ncbi:MAG: hypothetical protein OHK0021_13610 [Bryobacter sp.]
MKWMGFASLTLGLSLAAASAQELDLSFLKELEKQAEESTDITLGKDQLDLFKSFTGGKDGDKQSDLAAIANGLEFIQVKVLQFAKPGVYNIADMESLKAKVRASGGASLVSVKEKSGFTEIFMRKGPNGANRGFVILVAEPREVTVVNVVGNIDLASLGKLGGKMGIPDMQFGNTGPSKGTPKKGNNPQEEEDFDFNL